ncbi:methyltransferase domain-containing protein [Chitinophaga sp. GbtcB8]|uniref:methyltransferase domain-containing protein n=1 Tax=Chitinophaga sp. GbtcB8 TaxID=2824753 RepID=UPI001C2FE471|nr:methyltransferase domain-containing protein [Chitinophaga sp. GbtcB8]
MRLLTENELIWSSIVANNRMNRKRNASGINSYERELKFKPEVYLNTCLKQQGHVKWLDLCCGEGNALIQYARELADKGSQHRGTLLGIDLIDQFQPIPSFVSCLRFQISSLVNWENEDQYDLITCVHGLHYVGDKLKVLSQGLRSVSDQGLIMANLDLNNVKIEGDSKGQYLKKLFIENEIEYNVRRKLIICKGSRNINFNLTYKGADDKTGPNYTGQDAVDSYYS